MLHNTEVCPYCYQWLKPDNHRMRLQPKRRPSARVQSVLRRKARGKRLSLMQKNLLHRFQNSSSVLVRQAKHYNPTDLLMYCTALQHIILAKKTTRGIRPNQCPQLLCYCSERKYCIDSNGLVVIGFLGQAFISVFRNNTIICLKTI